MFKFLCFTMLLLCWGVTTYSQEPEPRRTPQIPPRTSDPQVPSDDPRQSPFQRTGRVTGTVRGPNGELITDVTIQVINTENGEVVAVVSPHSDDGQFEISNLKLGTYRLRVIRKGFQPLISPVIRLSLASPTGAIVLRCCDVPTPEPDPKPTPRPTPKPTPKPTPPPSTNRQKFKPTGVKVINLDFSSSEQLQEWLEGEADVNRRVSRIINLAGQTSIFVLQNIPGDKRPEYEVIQESGSPESKTIKKRIDERKTKVFVGIHRLGDTAYLMVFYE